MAKVFSKDPPIYGNITLNQRVSQVWANYFLEVSRLIPNQEVNDDSSPAFVDLTLTGNLTLNGGFLSPPTIIDSDYTALESDLSILIDGSSNSVTLTMPASPITGQLYRITCKDSSNTVLVSFNGNNFNGSTSDFELFSEECINIIYDGADWSIN